MAKKPETNPFAFDPTKFMGEFDPTKFMGEFTKLAGEFKMPGLDINTLVDSQRKNLEALTAANRLAVEGVQAVAKRQAEILQQTMEEVQGAVEQLSKAEGPQDAAVKQTELAKEAFEKALANMRELAEMVAKSNSEATDTVTKRVAESLDEIKALASSMKG